METILRMLIIVGILWQFTPIVLLILWRKERKAREKSQAALREFLSGERPYSPAKPMLPPAVPQYAPPGIPAVPPAAEPAARDTASAPAPAVFTPPTFTGTLAVPPAAVPQSAAPEAVLSDAPVTDTSDIEAPAADTPVTDAPVTDAPVTETPVTETTAAEIPAAEAPAADTFRTERPYAPPVSAAPVSAPAPHYSYGQQAPRTTFQVSAITAMLGVGVVLIVVAGLLYVLSYWQSLGNSGKLVTLAAGSALFFGASALARRVFKLDRTGMAFFVIGSAFLPISVWGAGSFGLLGEGLHSPRNNLLIALAFLSFTVIAFIAVRIYMQLGWGIAFLAGLTCTYLYFVRALLATEAFETDFQYAVFLIFSSCWALLFSYLSRTVKNFCPLPIARSLEPFAVGYTVLNAAFMLTLFAADEEYMVYGAAALLAAAAFFSPVLTDRLKEYTAIPVGCMALLGFWRLFEPIRPSGMAAFFALILTVCALLYFVLLLTNSLPEHCRKGFSIGAYVFAIAAMIPQLDCKANIPLILLLCVLIAATVIYAHRTDSLFARCLTAAEVFCLCLDISNLQTALEYESKALLICGLLLGGFLLFCAVRKFRTVFSDYLFLAAANIAAVYAMTESISYEGWKTAEITERGAFIAGLCLSVLIAVIYWFLATSGKKALPRQYGFAVLLPLNLMTAAAVAGNTLTEQTSLVVLLWSVISYAVALLTYFTTKKRFHGVRRLLFALCVVPPMIAAFFAEYFVDEGWQTPLLLTAAAMALLLWQLFAGRGFRGFSIAGFAVSLLFVLEATWYGVNTVMFDSYTEHSFSFTVLMLTTLWIIALSIAAIVIRNRLLNFVGCDAVPDVMQVVTPVTALLLACNLLTLRAVEWAALFPVFTILMCVIGWLTTRRTQIVLPSLVGLALLLTLESVRQHAPWRSYTDGERHGAVIFMLACFAGLILLFPYLGKVLREENQPQEEKHRSYVLTAMGGLIPFWALIAACDTVYSRDERGWIRFFVPVLAAGYLLHFVKEVKDDSQKRGLMTASAACVTVAFWMQPFVNVNDTYWEGKLHLLPLIGFAVVLRLLYGKESGGLFLFAAGVYTMLRLGIAAISSDSLADFLTLLICAMAVFLVSFYVKQKKWFLLGGVSLIMIALYLHMKVSMNWWGFLLLAGLLLIGVAGANEMLKKRGESLTEKAGRLWEDWRW